ncbi:unnamed protein product [Mytilus coruscus]|uniref:Reverse transcriptase domain-containing protein n=1 Tax=Mytilus coruscus TaxID=42192 RepID=A0A6J8AFZ1_MYTCO|nr:unnamed protein product [Mytilus coruscus]
MSRMVVINTPRHVRVKLEFLRDQHETIELQVQSKPIAKKNNDGVSQKRIINKCGKEPVRTPRCETVSRSSVQAEVVENPAAVSSNPPILPLEANLNADAVQDFDLDYLDDPVYVPPSGVCARADDSPTPVDFDTSFDPALAFSDAFRAPLSEINVPVSQPVVEKVEQYDYDFAWEIPQLNTEEKTGPKISSSLSKTVNAAISVKSNQDSHGFLSPTQRRRSALRLYCNDKFKPICNSGVPVDSSLFGADCIKQIKELGDYTKIPIANPRFLGRGSRKQRISKRSQLSERVLPEQPFSTIVKVRELNYPEWENITSDLWILDIVRNGYKIEFDVVPQGLSFMNEIHFPLHKFEIISVEVQKLLAKGTIKEVDSLENQFISNIFLVPKKDGSSRPVINLKNVNNFVAYHHFKQEHLSFVLDVIQRDDYLTSIDLTDAYFSISINNDFKKYLRFMWKGHLYEFQVLCSGLASAPRVFTKVLKPVYAFFRKNGIRCMQKLDELGFSINYKKFVLISSKRIVFFDLIIDTELFKIFLTDEKIDKIISLGKIILQQKCVTVRCFASFIGLVVRAFNAVSVGPLHYRNMERNKVEALNSCYGDFDSEIIITQESKIEIFLVG